MMNINTVAHFATIKNVGMHYLALTAAFSHHQDRGKANSCCWDIMKATFRENDTKFIVKSF